MTNKATIGQEQNCVSDEVDSLHRYFICANRMRYYLDETVKEVGLVPPVDLIELHYCGTRLFTHLSCWLGFLYVVIDGWKSLRLSDPRIDELLASPNVAKLKQFRNGVFHFQKDYYDKRLEGFLHSEDNKTVWADLVHREFSRYFLEQYGE